MQKPDVSVLRLPFGNRKHLLRGINTRNRQTGFGEDGTEGTRAAADVKNAAERREVEFCRHVTNHFAIALLLPVVKQAVHRRYGIKQKAAILFAHRNAPLSGVCS
ncbi:hypothetical protein SDC9_173489 [bioreactor metagenome]|uniref:Uncharacterized protein n=1 Tax=bioreactor metagenome TaxID=1076179 RepID=A0A645GGL0_9ZZZZ